MKTILCKILFSILSIMTQSINALKIFKFKLFFSFYGNPPASESSIKSLKEIEMSDEILKK